MHPALSVILFTSASGGGYMLLALMGLMSAAGLLPADRGFGLAGFGLGLGAIGVGLIASTFHLGHPERAWRAFSQWRSSWLSREGILALATFVPSLAFAWGWVIEGRIWVWAAISTAMLSVATILATAMIYASLKPIRAWNNSWTLPSYLFLGLCSGGMWAAFLAAAFGLKATAILTIIAIKGAIASGLVKLFYWRHIDRAGLAASAQSAIGLAGAGAPRPLFAPQTEENYLMKEMGFRIARKHSSRLRSLALWGGFIVPGVLALAGGHMGFAAASFLLLLAALLNGLGTLTERWLFFAEARHTITLYYREQPDS